LNKYIEFAKELKMTDAVIITPRDICFDIRAILKCLWGCENDPDNIRCNKRDLSIQERMDMVKAYHHILLVHANDASSVSLAVLEIERRAFLDGYYFSSALRTCNICPECSVKNGQPCPNPKKIRPCDSGFGIDIYKTVRSLGLPINVLQNKTDMQNRYGFVLID